jgi:hypothetical protein
MTLIVAMANSQYALQLSDRRTTAGDRPQNEEFDKSVIVYTRDGRMIVGFSGLAVIPKRFDMREWLTRALLDSAKPDHTGIGLIQRFSERANSDFQSAPLNGVDARDRRTTFHFCGFMRRGPYSVGSAVTLSNWQDFASNANSDEAQSEFLRWSWNPQREGSDAVYLRAIGTTRMITDPRTDALGEMLRRLAPAKEAVTFAEQVFQGWAADELAGKLVGQGMDAIWMPADFRENVVARYHPSSPSHSHRMPPVVDATSATQGYALRGASMTRIGGSPWTYPSTPRNARCPCGSGKKYKRCHLGQPQAVEWEPWTVFPALPGWPLDELLDSE